MQFPITAITKVDTLNYRIHTLQLKVDSLERIVAKTEIGTGFFSEIISLQLAIFVFILGFSAFISWKWFINQINRVRDETKSYTDREVLILESQLNKHKDETKEKNDDIEDSINRTIYDVNRAMYARVLADNDWANGFDWGLSCSEMLYKIYPDDFKGIEAWLVMSNRCLIKCQIGEVVLVENIERIHKTLKHFESIEENEIKKILSDILKTVNHLVYTIPAVPEDLVERPSDTNTEDVEHEEAGPTESHSTPQG